MHSDGNKNRASLAQAESSLRFGASRDRSAGRTYRAETDGCVGAGVRLPRDAHDFSFRALELAGIY
jgi:hypothetical protein